MKRYIFQIINNKIRANKDDAQRLYSGNYKLFFVNFSNTRFLLSSDWTNVFATFFRSSLSVLFLWKLRLKMELKQNESIADLIHNRNRNTKHMYKKKITCWQKKCVCGGGGAKAHLAPRACFYVSSPFKLGCNSLKFLKFLNDSGALSSKKMLD